MILHREMGFAPRRSQQAIGDRVGDPDQRAEVFALQQQAVGKPLARDGLLDD
jgi:hypothetical protein